MCLLITKITQGSILGLTLFLCYINDLVLVTRGLGVNISLYADDAVLYSSDSDYSRLKIHRESLLSIVLNWSQHKVNIYILYINLNVQKTKFCIYGYRSRVRKFHDTIIEANGQQITTCHQYNYLGVQLDKCMTLTTNFNSIFKKYSYKIFQFGKIRKYLDKNTRILVYKQTILPLFEYVSFMLCLYNACDVNKLQKLQNRCLRSCLDIYDPMEMGTLRLHELVRVNMLSTRHEVQLLNKMFSFKLNNKYKKESACVTRNADRFEFRTEIVHKDIYAKSPFLHRGTSLE